MANTRYPDFYIYDLSASHTVAPFLPDPRFHHHNELELLFMPRGDAVHEHAGRGYPMPLRRLIVFWGGIAHRASKRGPDNETYAVHIPIQTFLHWGLPRETFVFPLLRGEIFVESDPAQSFLDETAMRRWFGDIRNPPSDPAAAAALRTALLCELQARLIRFAAGTGVVCANPAAGADNAGSVVRMLRCIAQNYRDPALDVTRIARDAGINPNYANDTFRKTCGLSLMRYVTRQRVTHAKCLLASGEGKVIDIALDSGFGSPSRFYQVFRAATGSSPRDYAK